MGDQYQYKEREGHRLGGILLGWKTSYRSRKEMAHEVFILKGGVVYPAIKRGSPIYP
jgi:hypothetical protein